MARGYSNDLRVRVIRAVAAGTAAREAARQFAISASAAIKWVQRWRREGSMSEKPGAGHSRSPLKAHEHWLLELVRSQPDLTLEEIRAKLVETHGHKAGISSLWRFFDRHGISFKKKACVRPSRTDPMCRRRGRAGELSSPVSIRPGSCSSTKQVRPPTWRGAMAEPRAGSGSSARCRTGIG